jgi:hypothetical protein
MTSPQRAYTLAFADAFLRPTTNAKHTLQIYFDWQYSIVWPPKDGLGPDWLSSTTKIDFKVYLCGQEPSIDLVASEAFYQNLPSWVTSYDSSELTFLDVNTLALWSEFAIEVRSQLWSDATDIAQLRAKQDTRFEGVPRMALKRAPNWYFDYIDKISRAQGEPPVRADLAKQYVEHAALLLKRLDELREITSERALSLTDETPGQRAIEAFKKLCTDEPTLGHLFRVLFTVEAPLAVNAGTDYWLLARPVVQGTIVPLSDIQPVLTRARLSSQGLLTILDANTSAVADPVQTYVSDQVAVHQFTDGEISPSISSEITTQSLDQYASDDRALHSILGQDDLESAAEQILAAEWRKLASGGTQDLARLEYAKHQIVSAVASLEASRLGYDAIGLSWDAQALQDATAVDPSTIHSHRGYKGYRVYVRSATDLAGLKSAPWKSLCRLKRNAVQRASHRVLRCDDGKTINAALGRQGYLPAGVHSSPVQSASVRSAGSAVIDVAISRDQVIWAGSSIIKSDPLDDLAQLPNQSPDAGIAFPVQLEEIALRGEQLLYKRFYEFCITRVGLSGICTDLEGLQTPSPTKQPGFGNVPSNVIAGFVRRVPMLPPRQRFQPIDISKVCETSDSGECSVPRLGEDSCTTVAGEYRLANGVLKSPRVVVEFDVPLCHWRVALHTRGLQPEEAGAWHDSDFAKTCRRFAMKVHNSVAASKNDPQALHLWAVDPFCAGVKLVSKVWYPFSDRHSLGHDDKFLVTGRQTQHFDFRRKSFSDLVIRGEELADATKFSNELTAHVTEASPKPNSNDVSKPVLFLGMHNRLEISGVYTDEYASPLPPEEIASAAFTVYPQDGAIPIGGEIDREHIRCGFYEAHYAGPAPLDLERRLAMPPLDTGGSSNACVDQSASLARGSIQQWRHYSYRDRDANPPRELFEAYGTYLAAMIAGQNAQQTSAGQDQPWTVNFTTSCGGKKVVPVVTGPFQCIAAPDGLSSVTLPASANGAKQLPFIDVDIIWTVAMRWRIDLKDTHIERPRDLAMVKQFQLYRREKKLKKSSEQQRPEILIGTIDRPSESALCDVNLDEIEWLWVDCITDRNYHSFEYSVKAVPEYPAGYASQEWYAFKVEIQSSRFDEHIHQVVPLPTLEDSVALYLTSSEDRQRAKRIAFRLSAVKPDPLLGGQSVDLPPISMESAPTLAQLYPATPPQIHPEDTYDTLEKVTVPYLSKEEGWTFTAGINAEDDGHDSNRAHVIPLNSLPPALLSQHPFVRLQLSVYEDEINKYPCLRHTASSDMIETEWLQIYPHSLGTIAQVGNNIVIGPNLAWAETCGNKGILSYRFSAFAKGQGNTQGPSLHVATVYRDLNAIALDEIRRVAQDKLTELTGLSKVANVSLAIYGEEGFLAPTYETERDPNHSKDKMIFVPMRAAEGTVVVDL